MEIISKTDALSLGLTRYFTGIPCKRGGISERSVTSNNCFCEECRDHRRPTARNNCRRAYERKMTPEALARRFEMKSNPEAYKAKKAAERKERETARLKARDSCPEYREKVRKTRAERYQKDPSYRQRALDSSLSWRIRSKDHLYEKGRRWKQENPSMVTAYHASRRARKLHATPKWFGELDEFAMVEAAELCKGREFATGYPWHVDHMIPLQAKNACGLHCAHNLQVIPSRLNIAKSNRMIYTEPLQWLT